MDPFGNDGDFSSCLKGSTTACLLLANCLPIACQIFVRPYNRFTTASRGIFMPQFHNCLPTACLWLAALSMPLIHCCYRYLFRFYPQDFKIGAKIFHEYRQVKLL